MTHSEIAQISLTLVKVQGKDLMWRFKNSLADWLRHPVRGGNGQGCRQSWLAIISCLCAFKLGPRIKFFFFFFRKRRAIPKCWSTLKVWLRLGASESQIDSQKGRWGNRRLYQIYKSSIFRDDFNQWLSSHSYQWVKDPENRVFPQLTEKCFCQK